MKLTAHTVQTAAGVDHNGLGRLKLFALLQSPAEVLRIYTELNAGHVVRVHIGGGEEVAAVDQAEAVDLARELVGIRSFKRHKRIEMVTARTAQALYRLSAIAELLILILRSLAHAPQSVTISKLQVRQIEI